MEKDRETERAQNSFNHHFVAFFKASKRPQHQKKSLTITKIAKNASKFPKPSYFYFQNFQYEPP